VQHRPAPISIRISPFGRFFRPAMYNYVAFTSGSDSTLRERSGSPDQRPGSIDSGFLGHSPRQVIAASHQEAPVAKKLYVGTSRTKYPTRNCSSCFRRTGAYGPPKW